MITLQLLENLILDTSASWLRMLVALAASIVISLFVGIYTARARWAERIVLPIVDILQTLPILAFFPFVIYVVVATIPGYIGINAAVVFLIITSMIWNIIFAVYESIKTLPREYDEVASLYKLGRLRRWTRIYIPAAIPRLVEQSELSWAIGLFYLVTSEIFSTGNANYAVHYGIGVALVSLATSGDFQAYALGIGVFIAFVIATRFLLFSSMEKILLKKNMAARQIHPQHGLLSGTMHRFRLFNELQRIEKREQQRLLPKKRRTAAASSTASKLQLPARPSRSGMMWTALLFVALLVLYAAGYINSTTLNYEGIVLVSLGASFARVWLTFVVVLAVAVPLCVFLVFYAKKISNYMTFFQILASIPATIVLPIIAYAFVGNPNQGELVAFCVFFLSGIWYVVFSTIAGARTLAPEVFDLKRLFHVGSLDSWRKIYTKALLPGLITGAVTAIAAEWNASIVAEYFTSTGVGAGMVVSSVNTGIGKLLDTSLGSGNLLLMGIALINLTIMIILINTFVWKRLYAKVSSVYR